MNVSKLHFTSRGRQGLLGGMLSLLRYKRQRRTAYPGRTVEVPSTDRMIDDESVRIQCTLSFGYNEDWFCVDGPSLVLAPFDATNNVRVRVHRIIRRIINAPSDISLLSRFRFARLVALLSSPGSCHVALAFKGTTIAPR